MQVPIRPFGGQKKPWNSIPRINWGHPLTRGMVFYGYDTGAGLIADLTAGGAPTLLNSPQPSNAFSKFGTGRNYSIGGGSLIYPAQAKITGILPATKYSLACAWFITTLPTAGNFACPFGLNVATGLQQNSLIWAQTTANDMQWAVANSTGTSPLFTANSTNTYHSFVGTNTGAATQNIYFDGALKTTSAITSAVTAATAQVCFNTNDPTGINVGNEIAGFVYYGIIWNRTITSQEAGLLHNDPYCFLIYPEDEMFAALVGSSVAPPPGPNNLSATWMMMGV